MTDLLTEIHGSVFVLTLNRVEKHNAFDDNLITALLAGLNEAIANPQVRAIILKANGRHFSAGADLAWMQRMAQFSEEENLRDALLLARLMQTLYNSPKPTIAMAQGAAFGGGAGLVAGCDIAIASKTARFCFSEVKVGLIPAVISPYVVRAIGERATKYLFMTAETLDADQAKHLGLVQHCVAEDELWSFTLNCAEQIASLAPEAVRDCKRLVDEVTGQPIDDALMQKTACLIAKKRVSVEGQRGLYAFLNKETPQWN